MPRCIQLSAIFILLLILGLLLGALLFPVPGPALAEESQPLPWGTGAPAAEAAPFAQNGPEGKKPLRTMESALTPTALSDETDPPTMPAVPEPLRQALAGEDLSPESLNALGCRKLILVRALPGEDRETVTDCYSRDDAGVWTPVADLTDLPGHVGKNGVVHDRRRNTETTPAGLWALGFAFGNSPRPEGMTWPWRDVTPNTDWVCDEASPYFNTWQERGDPDKIPWSEDVEHLEDYPTQYAYACVIEYNTPPGEVVPDRGCAIFLHCSTGPTGGCVGLEPRAMIAVLQWLDPEQNPHILILPPAE